jgi:transcriptional regulator with XRE-family HTH domain
VDDQEHILRKSIGRRIKKAREKIGWSQTELGRRLGKEPNSISNYEAGNRAIRITDLPRLAELLNISIAYLFGEDESVEDIIAVVRQLDRANRRFALSNAKKLLESQKRYHADPADFLTLEKHYRDGPTGYLQLKKGEPLDDYLKDGWTIIDPEED